MRQEPVLLGLVEAVDLVHEQKGSLPVCPPDLGRLKDFAQLWHARKDRRDLDEMQIRFLRQKPRDGGFTNARRPPENQRTQAARIQHHTQRRIGP